MDLALASLEPLPGGYSGETFLAEVAGERVVVRIYGGRSADRGPTAPEVDAAVVRLVRGLLPVPEVLEARRADAATGAPGLLVSTMLPGERGDLVLPHLDAAGRATAGAAVGRVAATLAGMPTLGSGSFVDGALTIGDDLDDLALDGWAEQHRGDLTGRVGWTDGEVDALVATCREAQELLDTVDRRCLVHSDLNPKNLLVDPGTLEVTGVLDWEFAHAGHPATDLGNLLRFDRDPAYAEAVVAAWLDRHDGSTAETVALARAADLWALVDLAARRGQNPVADRAHDLLLAVARSGDPGVALPG